MRVYSDVNPDVFNGAYARESVDKIAAETQ